MDRFLKASAFRYLYLGLLTTLAIAGLVHLQHHFIDYPVYELAGKKLLEGRAYDLYELPGAKSDGFYYAYLFALLFVPLTVLGPSGKLVFLGLLFASYLKVLSFATTTAFCQLNVKADHPFRFAYSFALVLLTTYAMNDALMNANIGVLLLVLAIFAFEQREKRPYLSGILLATAIVIKTYPIILLGYFVWEKKWRVVFAAGISAIVLLFALPIAIHGIHVGALLLSRYFFLISHFQELWGARGWHFGGHVFQNVPGTAIRVASLFGISEKTAYPLSMFFSCLTIILFYLKSFLSTSTKLPSRFRERMFVFVLAVVPMLVPVSWYNMGLFYAPILGFLLAKAIFKKDGFSIAALVVYTFLYCLTTPDLIGTELNQMLCFYAIPWVGLVGILLSYAGELVGCYPNQFPWLGAQKSPTPA